MIRATLQTMISKLCRQAHGEYQQQSNDEQQESFSAPAFLFTSMHVARAFPDLVESMLVLSYSSSSVPADLSMHWTDEERRREKSNRQSFWSFGRLSLLVTSMLLFVGSQTIGIQRLLVNFTNPVLVGVIAIMGTKLGGALHFQNLFLGIPVVIGAIVSLALGAFALHKYLWPIKSAEPDAAVAPILSGDDDNVDDDDERDKEVELEDEDEEYVYHPQFNFEVDDVISVNSDDPIYQMADWNYYGSEEEKPPIEMQPPNFQDDDVISVHSNDTAYLMADWNYYGSGESSKSYHLSASDFEQNEPEEVEAAPEIDGDSDALHSELSLIDAESQRRDISQALSRPYEEARRHHTAMRISRAGGGGRGGRGRGGGRGGRTSSAASAAPAGRQGGGGGEGGGGSMGERNGHLAGRGPPPPTGSQPLTHRPWR